MKKAVVAIDFSDASMYAAKYAGRLSNDIPMELHLLNIYHLPNPIQTLPIELLVTSEELEKATISKLKQMSEIIAKEMTHPERIHIHSENGVTEKEILRYADFIGAEFIVLGMQKSGIIRDRILGSSIDPMLRHSKVPLLIVPKNYEYNGIQTIALMNDGEPLTGAAGINFLRQIQKESKAKLEVFQLNAHRELIDKDLIMEKLEPQLHDMPHTYSFPETEYLNETITTISKERHADLMVMQSHHHTLLGQLFGNDHTKTISHHSEQPLLILPA